MYIPYIITVAASFIIGSVPFGFLISKIKGVDIRNLGSGNIGATNVYRIIGKKEGALALILDFLKGVLTVILLKTIFDTDQIIMYIAAVGVVLGHDFSLFLKFKGGKGVATTYGSTMVIAPYASLLGMAVWILILVSTKYSSIAALVSFGISTLICFLSYGNIKGAFFAFLLFLMIIRHLPNIKRFYNKSEHKLNIMG